MSFEDMTEALKSAYRRNVTSVRMRRLMSDGAMLIGNPPGQIKVPVLSGPSGIGKTACVRQFAEAKGFELVELDASYMPALSLATTMYGLVGRIQDDSVPGCVLLIVNFDEASDECLSILSQYGQNVLNAEVNVAEDAHANHLKTRRVSVEELPETLFIVGEQVGEQS